jgi:hypothetical protein
MRISGIESYKEYGCSLFSRYMAFHVVDHCLCVQERALIVRLKGSPHAVFREGETVVNPAGQTFALVFDSNYVRVWAFTDGDGIESLVHQRRVGMGSGPNRDCGGGAQCRY